MTDLEISKTLALAIGWKPEQIRIPVAPRDGMKMEIAANYGDYWRVFDYRDWNVIGPIAERYDCFPKKNPFTGLWVAVYCDGEILIERIAGTPQKAIALAFIGELK